VFRCGDIENNQNGHYTKLNKEWQFFMFDLAGRVVFKRPYHELTGAEYEWLAGKFTSVYARTTAFCNGLDNGFDQCVNYITGEQGNGQLPKIYTLVCGGASLVSRSVVTNTQGTQMLKVSRFDGTQPPPPIDTIDPYTDPRVFFATTITGVRVNGGYKVNRFDQYDGSDVAVPLIASADIYFPVRDTHLYQAAGSKWSPYFPAS